jgi:hypothetical protein
VRSTKPCFLVSGSPVGVVYTPSGVKVAGDRPGRLARSFIFTAKERVRPTRLEPTTFSLEPQSLKGCRRGLREPANPPYLSQFLFSALCCTVLCSRWCQSGVKIALVFRFD